MAVFPRSGRVLGRLTERSRRSASSARRPGPSPGSRPPAPRRSVSMATAQRPRRRVEGEQGVAAARTGIGKIAAVPLWGPTTIAGLPPACADTPSPEPFHDAAGGSAGRVACQSRSNRASASDRSAHCGADVQVPLKRSRLHGPGRHGQLPGDVGAIHRTVLGSVRFHFQCRLRSNPARFVPVRRAGCLTSLVHSSSWSQSPRVSLELLAGEVEPAHDGADGDVLGLGDFLVAEARLGEQDERRSDRRAESVQGGVEPEPRSSAWRPRAGSSIGGGGPPAIAPSSRDTVGAVGGDGRGRGPRW